MKKLRFIALLLVAMLVVASCGGNGDGNTDKGNPDKTPTDGATDVLGLPEGLDYTGETFRLITAEGYLEATEEDRDSGDVIAQARYKQFLNVTDRLGVEFEFFNATPFEIASTWVYTAVNSWSDEYDAVFTVDGNMRTMADMGFFKTVSELPYVNLDNPWWSKDYIESVSLNPHDPYLLFGSITFNSIERLVCVTFNKRLLEEIHGMQDEDIYQMVLDGEWTIDKFLELAKGVYIDNGDGINNGNDVHGYVTGGNDTLVSLAYSSGLDFTGRDADGFPTLQMNNERTITLVEKLLTLKNDVSYYDAAKDNNAASSFPYARNFADGKALFLVQRFFTIPICNEMSDDYGMVPMPKFDEDTDGYTSIVSTHVQWGAVPVTCERVEMTSATLEALAYEGYQHLTPAYFENTLKLRYTRGDLGYETQMLDLIVEGADTDFIYVNSLGGLGSIFGEIFEEGENIFASTYDSYEPAALVNIEKLIAAAQE